jgi:hypothetical protein
VCLTVFKGEAKNSFLSLFLSLALCRHIISHSLLRYCGGGAGYSLNRAALKVLLEEQFYINKCGVDLERLGQEASDEDRIGKECSCKNPGQSESK